MTRKHQSPSLFTRFAKATSRATGHSAAFMFAASVIAVWAVSGPIFAFSNTWQLVINTFTTISTFLMVFLIQNTQNRDTEALQTKLDELIRSSRADNTLLALEELADDEIDAIRKNFLVLAKAARREGHAAGRDHGPQHA